MIGRYLHSILENKILMKLVDNYRDYIKLRFYPVYCMVLLRYLLIRDLGISWGFSRKCLKWKKPLNSLYIYSREIHKDIVYGNENGANSFLILDRYTMPSLNF